MKKELDICDLRDLLLDKGYKISHSFLSNQVALGKIKGFYKLPVSYGLKYKWYISMEDAMEFVQSFSQFRR